MRFSLALCLSLLAGPALAEPSRTILVLDSSGSMWGQIDGEAKIAIARRAVSDLLDTLPENVEIGLTAYGHRRKGDCGDIESLVPVGAQSRPAIRAAIEAIQPKGKTPLSDAVRAAAEELKYSEEKATVILVSDGRETCEADPCAVGLLLEETGVDFTAHVVGFDISDADDEAQLRCLAENTGGDFVSASNATELREALERVAAEPEVAVFEVGITASERGRPVTNDLIWTVTPEGGDPVLNYEAGSGPVLTLDPGMYDVEVLRTVDEAFGEMRIAVGLGEPLRHVVALEVPKPEATLSAPGTLTGGAPFEVEWTGPNAPNDRIDVVSEDGGRANDYAYTRDGMPAALVAPGDTGTYEIRYFLAGSNEVLTRIPLTVTDAAITLSDPGTLPAGTPMAIEWTGPNAPNDRISVIPKGGGRAVDYAYTRDDSPAALVAPGVPGDYEIVYLSATDRSTPVRIPLTVTAGEMTLVAPDALSAGTPFEVNWTGPNAPNDRINLIPKAGGRAVDYAYTRDGSPAALVAPGVPGDYEIVYLAATDRSMPLRIPLTVTEAEVTLSMPDTVAAGRAIPVEWTGPDAPNDNIAVFFAQGNTRPVTYTYTREGSPLTLRSVAEPGAYELRYRSNGGNSVIATLPFTVVPAEDVPAAEPKPEPSPSPSPVQPAATPEPATPATPAPAPAADEVRAEPDATPGAIQTPGEAVTLDLLNGPVSINTDAIVLWTGPGGPDDGIIVTGIAAPDDAALGFEPLSSGNPVTVPMPSRAGGYELRYVDGTGAILGRITITLFQEPQ